MQTITIASRTPEEETHFLFDWKNQVAGSEWNSELLEALLIIQANLCLVKCGLDDDELRERFLPHVVELASAVHPVLKGLYQLCEKMDDGVTEKVIEYLKKNHAVAATDSRFFELVISELISAGVVKLGSKSAGEECDLLLLIACFKSIDLYDLAEFCKRIGNGFNKELTKKQNQSDNVQSSSNFKQIPKVDEQQHLDSDRYFILKQTAGVILIINQFKFYRDSNPELKDLLPLRPLNDRRGTEVDKLAILNIFTAFGYQPIIVENIPHAEIITQVERAVSAVKPIHCSLVVCLLSHGQEGKIYGSNSIPVNVKSIERAMAAEKLTGKPKLLFVQACQGSDLQSAVEIPLPLEHDGPSAERTASVFVDFLVAWSTVPGFASVRHIEKGSWFIQELCVKLRELHQRYDVLSI